MAPSQAGVLDLAMRFLGAPLMVYAARVEAPTSRYSPTVPSPVYARRRTVTLASLTLLANDYLALAKESGRRYSEVREAAEKAYQLIKGSTRDQALLDLHADPPPTPQPLYQPIFLAVATNSKVTALAVSCLQRLIVAGAVPNGLVRQILETLEQVIPQGVEIQLKILQTLGSLLTTTVGGVGEHRKDRLLQGEELGRTLELAHRLSTSKIPVVASTASATLRQLFMFVFERVGEEDAYVLSAECSEDLILLAALPPASFNVDVPAPEHDAAATPTESESMEAAQEGIPAVGKPTSIALRPAARDAYLLLEDLCLLISGSVDGGPQGEPSFLKWGSLSRTFGLELVESIVSGFGPIVRTHPELLLVLRAHLCPLLIRFLSAPPPSPSSSSSSTSFSFPLTLRLTRVVFLLLKQFSDLLPLESEVFLTMFIRVVGPGERGEGEGGHPSGPGSGTSPLWMRVLALEIFRGLCGDFKLIMKFYERYDAIKKKGGQASCVFSDLMTALSRLATEKPSVLGVGAAVTYGSSLGPILTASAAPTAMSLSGAAGMLDSAVEMGLGLAQVAGSVVGSSVGVAGSAAPGLSVATATLKLQCIDQLDKAEPPVIPETYIFLLALQCLSSLSEGFATYSLSAYSSLVAAKSKAAGDAPSRSPPALDWSILDRTDPKVVSLAVVQEMASTSWPALLASLSFFIATALDDDLFSDVVSALQNFTSVCGVLGLQTPREAFLTSLCKFAIPPAVVSHIASIDSSAPIKIPTNVLIAGVESLGLGPTAPLAVGLSSRNFACLRALISVAQYLAGSLDATWFAVFETLQNADFVIRTSVNRKKKASAPVGVPSTSPRPVTAVLSPLLPSSGNAATKIPVLPTEADEVAIQGSIAKLFEVSRSLDDDAFKWFVGALCRLNGEMIGIPMSEDGSVSDRDLPGGAPSPVSESSSSGVGDRGRRRSSGASIMRPLRLGEKSFGVSKLGFVSILNLHRLVYRDSKVGWNLVTSHLLLVLHYTVAPPGIRLQAAEVLDQILLAAPKNLSTGGADLQKRMQTQVLVALSEQAEPAMRVQNSTDIEIRRIALDTLFKILEGNGHSFIAGWERIFHVLRTACPPSGVLPFPVDASHLDTIDENGNSTPTSPSFFPDKAVRSPILVRTSFPSLQLICTDFLGALTIEELRDCIGTLTEFGRQADDVNVALTAGGLLWGVSDHLQAKRKDNDNEAAHGELWMFLLLQLRSLCEDSRQEVRDGAITTIFRSISLYGSSLASETWDASLWEVIFPLVSCLSSTIAFHNQQETDDGEGLVTQVNGPPIRLIDKQWDDSKTLALTSMGAVFVDFLVPNIIKTVRYEETWAAFVGHLKLSFVEDRPPAATAAMQAFEKALAVPMEAADAAKIASSWEVAWSAWEEIGQAVIALSLPSSRDSPKTFTQINLEAYVRVALPIYNPTHITFDLPRIQRLLAILKAVVTFARSPDYRPDIDTLTPLQASVLEAVAAIRLDVPGAASAVLTDLSEYLTLAFVAAFDSEPEAATSARSRPRPSQRVTYIALTKEVMPQVLELFQRFKDDLSIYEDGAVVRLLSAYALPIKLKHDCPPPSKYGSDELLWKTATVNFLKATKDCVASLGDLRATMKSGTFEEIWRQIVEGFKGALLADTVSEVSQTLEDQHAEENFDLAILIALEQDVIPHIGGASVPDDLIRQLNKFVQSASRLYELDLPSNQHQRSREGSPASSILSDSSPQMLSRESRFDSDYDRQGSSKDMVGTTAEVVELGRERFGYWCFDLLFLMCSDVDQDHGDERRRIAALALPSLLNRCSAVIKTYVADAPLRGKMPFPRVRQEELIYVLQKLLALRLPESTFFASIQSNPTLYLSMPAPKIDSDIPLRQLIRSALLRSPLAHLYELHPLFTSLLTLSTSSPSITSAYIPYRRIEGLPHGDALATPAMMKGLPAGFTPKRIGRAVQMNGDSDGMAREEARAEMDVVQLTLGCLRKVGEEIGAGGGSE